MKINVENKTRDSVTNLMRSLGYKFQRQERDELSFVKPLTGSFFPRFHLYVRENGENISFTIHLDQKKPMYKGTTAHNADYDGDVVLNEGQRIKEFFDK